MRLSSDCALRSLGHISCFPTEMKSLKGGSGKRVRVGTGEALGCFKNQVLAQREMAIQFPDLAEPGGRGFDFFQPFFRRQEEFG